MPLAAAVDAGNLDPYEEFLGTTSQAANETTVREAFVGLAATAFADSAFVRDLALGAEHAVTFRQSGLIRRGRVDSFIDNVLIEFKINALTQQERWLEQLRGYVAGAWAEDGGYHRPYLAVLTDGRNWLVHAATPKDPSADPTPDNVELPLIDEWSAATPNDRRALSLARFLNRLFFRKTLLVPSAGNFGRDFGVTSPAFVAVSARLRTALRDLAGEPQLQTHREAWAEDIRTSYGGGDTPVELFVRHTYLALLARLLVFAALERRPLEQGDAEAVLDGTYFIGRRIGNLVEDDYFQWPLLASRSWLDSTWGALVNQLAGYDLAQVREDVLKPLYEQLVDPETRHDLGEYYTPDWLAEQVVGRALAPWLNGSERPRVLDPTCGSGSFLRAVVHRMRTAENAPALPEDLLTDLLEHVVGMDVNPLAVIVAKATYLLAIADLVSHAREIVHVPVYLCNSLSAQQRHDTASLFGDHVTLSVGGEPFMVPLELVRHGPGYDFAIGAVVSVARSFAGTSQPASAAASGLRARLADMARDYVQGELLLDSLAAMAAHLVGLIREGRDTIHGFLLRNKYRSVLLFQEFDLVVGNPPWLTIADVTAPDYRALVLQRADETRIAPRGAGEQAHTELATLFLAQAFRQFLAPRPDDTRARLAFVMPRSLFSATHHRNLREGLHAVRLNPTELWDLSDVMPLFNIPSCVVFVCAQAPAPNRLRPGRVYRGRLAHRDPAPSEAAERITHTEVQYALARLGRRSAWVVAEEGAEQAGADLSPSQPRQSPGSPYQKRFRQGAVLYPQTLLCVRPVGASGRGPGDVAIETDPASRTAAKVLADVEMRGVVERSCLFSTAAAEHLLPFRLSATTWTVVLPMLTDPAEANFRPVTPDELRRNGRIGTADWFDAADARWIDANSKPAPRLWERVEHLGHLSAQAKRSRWLVLYTSAGARPVAAVVDSTSTDFPFVVRDQTYWASFYLREEAHFVSALLNSDQSANKIRAFMTTGLFGPRHIHKRVLDVPIPLFDASNATHAEIAEIGRRLSDEAVNADPLLTVGRGARNRLRNALSTVDLVRLEDLASALLSPRS